MSLVTWRRPSVFPPVWRSLTLLISAKRAPMSGPVWKCQIHLIEQTEAPYPSLQPAWPAWGEEVQRREGEGRQEQQGQQPTHELIRNGSEPILKLTAPEKFLASLPPFFHTSPVVWYCLMNAIRSFMYPDHPWIQLTWSSSLPLYSRRSLLE